MDARNLEPSLISRRKLWRWSVEMGSLYLAGRTVVAPLKLAAQNTAESGQHLPSGLSPQDDAFLDELERASFQFFWEQSDPESGLVKDRCHVRSTDSSVVASIASTGFGLTALCIGQMRGYISPSDARNRVSKTLRFLWESMPNHRGFFYHYANIKTGERIWDSEVSSIDTAMLVCGVLTCRQYFARAEITRLADAILGRIEWTWLSEDLSLIHI